MCCHLESQIKLKIMTHFVLPPGWSKFTKILYFICSNMCCHLEIQIKLNYHNLYDPPCAAIWMVKIY